MILRPATLKDYEEIVAMYKELLKAVYPHIKLGEDIFIYGAVQSWYQTKKDIVLCENKDGIITGFTMAYIEEIGVVEPYYFGDIAYVKQEFRKGRSAYLLYNNVVTFSKRLGIPLIAKAFVGDGNKDQVDKIQSRWGVPIFTEYTTAGA